MLLIGIVWASAIAAFLAVAAKVEGLGRFSSPRIAAAILAFSGAMVVVMELLSRATEATW